MNIAEAHDTIRETLDDIKVHGVHYDDDLEAFTDIINGVFRETYLSYLANTVKDADEE